MEQKFYICEHCGNIIAKVKDTGVPVICCGQPMKEIVPGTVEASVEKHIPVYTVEGNIVKVSIQWLLNTSLNGYLSRLSREIRERP